MIVIEKYGGSVLKSVDDIIKIGNKIIDDYDRNNKYIIILSAIKNKTNELIEDINKVSSNINKYYSNYITLGEIQSSILLSSYLDKYFNVAYLDPFKLNLKCTNSYLDASLLSIDINRLITYLDTNDIIIIPGFQGINDSNEIVTLGRNGSDTTSVYIYKEISKITKAKCILYKDTSLYQIDPKIGKSLKHDFISYNQIELLNKLGNSIISSEAIKILKENNLELLLENINTNESTLISNKKSNLELLTIIPKKYYEIVISNINNKKIINHIKHLFKNNYIITNDTIKILTTKQINNYLDVFLLIDPNISFSYKQININEYIYDNKIILKQDDKIAS